MVHIEKLSLKNIGKYSWQTFVDHLLGDKSKRQHLLEKQMQNRARSFINTNMLSTHVFSKLKNVSVGKYYGFEGADIDLLLVSEPNIENLVIEISIDNINSLSKQKLKLLLEKYPVILNDFEECGTLYGPPNPHLIDILSSLNIKPKMLFLVGSCFQLNDYPELNIYKIPFEYWAVSTAVIDQYFSNCIFDKSAKQEIIDLFDSEPLDFCVVPLFKPRKNRVELLVQLDQQNLLEKTDWSLGYNIAKHNYTATLKYKTRENYTDSQLEFLSKHEFPKFIEGPTADWKDVISPLAGWLNKYKFQICAETYMGHEIPTPMGGCGAVTEKTYKSFLTGSTPIVYGPLGSTSHLKNYGFNILIDGYDSTNPAIISSILAEMYNNPIYSKEAKIHNFELLLDPDFLTGLICEPLHKIADLINSIRR